jgi:hypothetical protein
VESDGALRYAGEFADALHNRLARLEILDNSLAAAFHVAPADHVLRSVPVRAWGGSAPMSAVFSRVPIVRLRRIPDATPIDSVECAWPLALADGACLALLCFANQLGLFASTPLLLRHGLDNT